jgi:hypothetical protein
MCDSINDDDSIYCESCGAVLRIAAVAAGSGLPDMSPPSSSFAAEDHHDLFPVDSDIMVGPAGDDVDEVSIRHERLISKLDMMDRELEAKMRESAANLPGDSAFVEGGDALNALSTTLDALIADLLDVEIKEYSTPDFIHPDESGFPSRNPAAYKPRKQAKNLSLQEIVVIIVLTAAIFLVGMSCGLWSSYFFGF